VATGQLTCEGGRVGYASCYLASTVCFSASAAGTEALQQQLLLRSPTAIIADTTVSWVRNAWSSAANNPCTTGLAAYKQSTWDKPVVASDRLDLTNSLSNTGDQARLLAVTSHSGD